MNKPIAAFDLDDTLCSYKEHYKYCKEVFYGIEYPQSRSGFFLELEPIDGAIETINKLKEDFEIHILTRPSVKNLHCYSEKAEWVLKYLGEDVLNNLTISPHKNRYIADYLVDDVKWDGFKGRQLLFGSEGLETWDKVYDKLIEYVNYRDYVMFKSEYLNSGKSYLVINKNVQFLSHEKLEADLKKLNFKGKVYLDLLISNGLNTKRYQLCYFDGHKLQHISVHEANSTLQQISADFFQDNPQYLTQGVLSSSGIREIKSQFNPRRKNKL